jgi:hypothetical protein
MYSRCLTNADTVSTEASWFLSNWRLEFMMAVYVNSNNSQVSTSKVGERKKVQAYPMKIMEIVSVLNQEPLHEHV